MNWLLISSGALLGLSGLTALVYELYAVFTRKATTITDLVRNWEALSAANKGWVSGIGIGVVLGLVGLLVHFLGGF